MRQKQVAPPKKVKNGRRITEVEYALSGEIEKLAEEQKRRYPNRRVLLSKINRGPQWLPEESSVKVAVPALALKYVLFIQEYFLVTHGFEITMDQALNCAISHFLEAEKKNRKSFVFYVKVSLVAADFCYLNILRSNWAAMEDMSKRTRQSQSKLLLIALAVTGELFRENTYEQALILSERFIGGENV